MDPTACLERMLRALARLAATDRQAVADEQRANAIEACRDLEEWLVRFGSPPNIIQTAQTTRYRAWTTGDVEGELSS